jgi:uncharacterized protein (DUF2141 family)
MQSPNPLENFMFRTTLVSTLLAGLFTIQANVAYALDLTVEITGAKSSKGHVMAEIFSDADTWLKKPISGERVLSGDRVVLVFKNLPTGRHALSIFHDENGNGKLDTNLMGMPTEAFGFSRDAKGVMGPAKFDDAAIRMESDMTIKVTLQ